MLERENIEYGLVDVRLIGPTVPVDLKYGTTDNFVGDISDIMFIFVEE